MTAAITIHYKKPELTAGCIESLLADGWTPVLVWDNSDDGGTSFQVLRNRFSNDFRLLWIRSPSNVGFGKAMNGGIAALKARGYQGPILLINNDARVTAGMRPELQAALTTPIAPTLVAPRILQDGKEHGWLYYHPWLALVTQKPLPGSFAYLSGCCLLVNRPPNASPLFDEAFFMYGEDVELSWRVQQEGGKLVLLERAWLQHEGSASSGQASEAYERFLVQSHRLLAWRLATNTLSRTLMHVLRVPSLFARACVRSIRFKSLVPLCAFFPNIRGKS